MSYRTLLYIQVLYCTVSYETSVANACCIACCDRGGVTVIQYNVLYGTVSFQVSINTLYSTYYSTNITTLCHRSYRITKLINFFGKRTVCLYDKRTVGIMRV